MKKRYYWLKLNEDFFTRYHIKVLRMEPDGDSLVVIYLKLLLASINNGGTLSYEDEGEFATHVAIDMYEDKEKVRALLNFLVGRHLAEISGSACTFFEAKDCVGTESTSASRMRRARGTEAESAPATKRRRPKTTEAKAAQGAANDRKKLDVTLSGAQCNTNVTSENAQCDTDVTRASAQCDSDVTLDSAQCDARYRDRERDRYRDRDRAAACAAAARAHARADPAADDSDIFSLYEERIGPLTPHTAEKLRDLAARLNDAEAGGDRFVRYGIEEAAANNARTFAYIRTCAEAEAKRATGPPKKRRNDVRAAALKVEAELREEGFL